MADENSDQTAVYQLNFEALLDWIDKLPQNKETFGLIHADMHTGNFFWNREKITAIDFDDCCYHYFMYDLAVPLYYLERQCLKQGMDFQKLKSQYLRGYQKQRKLPKDYEKQIQCFSRYRLLLMYGWYEWQLQEQKLSAEILSWCREAQELALDVLKTQPLKN